MSTVNLDDFFSYLSGVVRDISRTVVQNQSAATLDQSLTQLDLCALNAMRVGHNLDGMPDLSDNLQGQYTEINNSIQVSYCQTGFATKVSVYMIADRCLIICPTPLFRYLP